MPILKENINSNHGSNVFLIVLVNSSQVSNIAMLYVAEKNIIWI